MLYLQLIFAHSTCLCSLPFFCSPEFTWYSCHLTMKKHVWFTTFHRKPPGMFRPQRKMSPVRPCKRRRLGEGPPGTICFFLGTRKAQWIGLRKIFSGNLRFSDEDHGVFRKQNPTNPDWKVVFLNCGDGMNVDMVKFRLMSYAWETSRRPFLWLGFQPSLYKRIINELWSTRLPWSW